MTYKVAIASSDGKYVNQHYGKAQNFLVFKFNDGGEYEFIEVLETPPRCGGSEEVKKQSLDMLSDCKALVVTQIGPSATQKLLSQGTVPLILPMFIEDALKEIPDLMKEYIKE